MVITEVLRGQLPAEQQGPVAFLECGLQMVERTAPGKGVEHQAQGNHTGLDLHLRGHQRIDDLHQPQAPCKVRHDG